MVTGAMARSRWVALAVLSAVFLAGAAVGVAGFSLLRRESTPERGPVRPDRRGGPGQRPSIFDQMELSASQKAAMDSIMEKRRRQMDAFWKDHNPEVRAIIDSARAEVDRLLTPEQRRKFEEFRERRRREHSERNGPGMPPPGSRDSSRRPISYLEPQYL